MTEQDKNVIGVLFNEHLIKKIREIGGMREQQSSFIKKKNISHTHKMIIEQNKLI